MTAKLPRSRRPGPTLRAGKNKQQARGLAAFPRSPRARTLRDWPVSWRLVAVIVLALAMGLVFGGLRVASAAGSAAEFGRVPQLASLGQQVTGLVQALQNERDETTGVSSGGNPGTLEGIEDFILTDGNPVHITQLGISLNKAPARWYSAMSDKIDRMQAVEQEVAGNIVARSQVLRRGAERSALFSAVLTTIILFLVLIATLAVARSLVRPLRRLREGALDIATVQLPERVRRMGEETDPATSLDVAPIGVLSADEIGQVARAFDQVHAEAVRLAGNEAMLRSSFNAMFVNLSRRSQSLIERLARMIDSLEQNEADPSRLSNLFSMDHLVTRMRRNSENLLLLAGHETARKRSEPVQLADVVRAATSEIEQYSSCWSRRSATC